MIENEGDENILITGASGFVGSALVERLLKQGCHVTAVYRRYVPIGEGNINPVLIDNIDEKTDWSLALFGCKSVIHLASRVHVMVDEAAKPLSEFLTVNLHGTTNLAKQAAAAGIKRFVYVSSIKVNGEHTSQGQSFNESDLPNPQDNYAISKWQAEKALQLISQETGMELVIIRPPLVYGPGVKANFLQLIDLLYRGIPMPFASVQNSRSLIYVGNLVDALYECVKHAEAANQIFLVSDGVDVSTPQLIKALITEMRCPNRVFSFSVNLMQRLAGLIGKSATLGRLTQSLVIDSSKIRNELGWQPPYSMKQGLQETVLWYQEVKQTGHL